MSMAASKIALNAEEELKEKAKSLTEAKRRYSFRRY